MKLKHISEPHWKAGDVMSSGRWKYTIGAIVVIDKRNGNYEIQFYDDDENLHGSIDVVAKLPPQ